MVDRLISRILLVAGLGAGIWLSQGAQHEAAVALLLSLIGAGLLRRMGPCMPWQHQADEAPRPWLNNWSQGWVQRWRAGGGSFSRKSTTSASSLDRRMGGRLCQIRFP